MAMDPYHFYPEVRMHTIGNIFHINEVQVGYGESPGAKQNELKEKYGDNYSIRISHTDDIPKRYTQDDESRIIQMKGAGLTDYEIAESLRRTYSGITDKIRRMRQKGIIL